MPALPGLSLLRLSPSSGTITILLLVVSTIHSEEPPRQENTPADFLFEFLAQPILGTETTQLEVKAFVQRRIPVMPVVKTVPEWNAFSTTMRKQLLDNVVFRGEAARWRTATTSVEWLDTLNGGEDYRIRKLRFEALPDLWIPALLYEPLQLHGQVPVVLNVNGHETRMGKAIPYKQLRCINLAKRGLLALNVEWLGTGQLNAPEYNHYLMNQLDLCGTSGLAPFFLAMQRGLDVLLNHPHADTSQVAVAGLSGGGWQTVLLSALDTRVTLCNPVAGYSSFLTRLEHSKDLGDSEQTPCDLATIADYTHLTALLAPRPALLTYNARDDCCFEAGYALPPLLRAAQPIYQLLGKPQNLDQHVNHTPGDHNFGRDNREAFYRLLSKHFTLPQNAHLTTTEIESTAEVKTRSELEVPLPANNNTFQTLAQKLSENLPREGIPKNRADFAGWQEQSRDRLAKLVPGDPHCSVSANQVRTVKHRLVQATSWKLRVGNAWSVPVVEFASPTSKAVVILLADAGKANTSQEIQHWLDNDYHVFAVDPFYFGESQLAEHNFLHALLIATVGDRPLSIQVTQVCAVARWITQERGLPAPKVRALGPRTSLIALVASAFDTDAIQGISVRNSLASLRQIIEKGVRVDQQPELFCFGLLQQFDIKHLAALTFPKHLHFAAATDRLKKELAEVNDLAVTLGQPPVQFD